MRQLRCSSSVKPSEIIETSSMRYMRATFVVKLLFAT
jgi:hypothetical protein